MSRHVGFVLTTVLLLLSACATAPRQDTAASSGWITHGTVFAGLRQFQDSDLKTLNLDSQTGFGAEVDSYSAGSGSGFEVGYSQSSDSDSFSGVGVEFSLHELYVGFRQTFMLERKFHPYVGAGASYMQGKAHASGFGTDTTTDLAPYIHAGVLWDVAQRWRLGLDFRMAIGADFDGTDGDYRQLALSAGFQF